MTEADRIALIQDYLDEVSSQFYSRHAREHSYRPALERLMMSFDKVHAVNEPKHSEHGAPDFVFLSNSNSDLILGYAEAKDINVSLDKTEKTAQMVRYGGYSNLLLTNYLEFRFFRNGEKYETISIGHAKNEKLYKSHENGERLMRELEAFLEQSPEKIKSGKRLAQIMGGKARRIRDNVKIYLKEDKNAELNRIYGMMKKMLVHDLSEEKFADMYAQTLVYGLFVARYNDTTPHDFSRAEARDLVPKSNPFLRHFFDHIVGPDFNIRLGYIVDELCDIFLASNVNDIVHKHLRVAAESSDPKDPIIHFYEDFLQEYDPKIRKEMGAYYTPTPVVNFIVREVDNLLKEDFSISRGLASEETFIKKVDLGQTMHVRNKRTGRIQKTTQIDKTFHRVQILDPAVGTATFLNEIIKYIHKTFSGQEGRWESYVNENLLKRLFGFELMMAPYTIAHLKLGMTLQETGVNNLNERLNIFLTNSLEEGVLQRPDIFSFGLAGAVSEESRLAADVKSEKPVMIIVGNPPYSGESNNKIKLIEDEINRKYLYRNGIRLDERGKKNWLQDDYVKFISYAENMIIKNGEGIVAMITNNGYLDNPTFRNMRYHLRQTFDKIYVYDLHGNSNKSESKDGVTDINVFDILQGVSIVLAVKTTKSRNKLADIFHAEIYGSRKEKFTALESSPSWKLISPDPEMQYFKPIASANTDYMSHIALNELFNVYGNGVITSRDKFVLDNNEFELSKRVNEFANLANSDEDIREKYNIKDNSMWSMHKARQNMSYKIDESKYRKISYRPFDDKFIYFDKNIVMNLRLPVMKYYSGQLNQLGLLVTRMTKEVEFRHVFVTDKISEAIFLSPSTGTNAFNFPLYVIFDDGTVSANFVQTKLNKFTQNLNIHPTPEDIFDYIYAILHSRTYRQKYAELLKINFPRIPIPNNDNKFNILVKLGRKLRNLHLMTSPTINNYVTTFPSTGSNIMENIKQQDEKIWINSTQYFGNVPKIAWEFYIGGYQPAQKWLKDRKGQKLSGADIDQYQKIIKILVDTDEIMMEIDSKYNN